MGKFRSLSVDNKARLSKANVVESLSEFLGFLVIRF